MHATATTAWGCSAWTDDREDKRGGSHMLVTGVDHTYTRFGGLLAGTGNSAAGDWASVTGGNNNTASSREASVTGGQFNEASVPAASVTGAGRTSPAATKRWCRRRGEHRLRFLDVGEWGSKQDRLRPLRVARRR